jgi:hypothetical protein
MKGSIYAYYRDYKHRQKLQSIGQQTLTYKNKTCQRINKEDQPKRIDTGSRTGEKAARAQAEVAHTSSTAHTVRFHAYMRNTYEHNPPKEHTRNTLLIHLIITRLNFYVGIKTWAQCTKNGSAYTHDWALEDHHLMSSQHLHQFHMTSLGLQYGHNHPCTHHQTMDPTSDACLCCLHAYLHGNGSKKRSLSMCHVLIRKHTFLVHMFVINSLLHFVIGGFITYIILQFICTQKPPSTRHSPNSGTGATNLGTYGTAISGAQSRATGTASGSTAHSSSSAL